LSVLAKASIPFLILPLLIFAIILVLQFIMLLLSSAVQRLFQQNKTKSKAMNRNILSL
jgi:hypothetical protein